MCPAPDADGGRQHIPSPPAPAIQSASVILPVITAGDQ